MNPHLTELFKRFIRSKDVGYLNSQISGSASNLTPLFALRWGLD
jgi:hypothetical protein